MVCLRSPVETAASLLRRPYDPPVAAAEWGEQWLAHIGAALAATREAPRLLVAYDDLLRDGAAEAARLAEFAGLPCDAGAIAAAIEPGLRHHARSLLATAEDPGISAAARGAYLSLLAAARARRSGDAPELADALEAMAVEHARAPRAAAPSRRCAARWSTRSASCRSPTARSRSCASRPTRTGARRLRCRRASPTRAERCAACAAPV